MTDAVPRDTSSKPAPPGTSGAPGAPAAAPKACGPAKPPADGAPAVAKPDAGHPAAVPDHAFEASIAGEEDPGASLDNNANGVPPPKDTSSAAADAQAPIGTARPCPPVRRPNSRD